MTQLKLIRTTHNGNCRCRSFSPEAWQFWWDYGALIGDVLRAESALTLTEILAAGREYALEYTESGSCSALIEDLSGLRPVLYENGCVSHLHDPSEID